MRGLAPMGLVLVLALSGCSVCDQTLEQARWYDPRVFDAMEGPAAIDRASGLPGPWRLQDHRLDGRWGEHDLVGVHHEQGPLVEVFGDPRFETSSRGPGDGWIEARYKGQDVPLATHEADVRAYVVSIVGEHDAGEVMADLAADVATAVMGNAFPGGGKSPMMTVFHAALPPTWTPQEVWDGLDEAWALPSSAEPVGTVILRKESWSFTFAVPVKRGASVSSDAEGQVEFSGILLEAADGNKSTAAEDPVRYLAWVREILKSEGLPTPRGPVEVRSCQTDWTHVDR